MKGVHTVNCSEVIRERRSIRKYKENVIIPQEDFERMLDALYGNTGRFLSGKVELASGDTAKGNAFQTM